MLDCDDASWPTCTTRARSMFGAVGRTERDVNDQLLHLRVVDLLYVSLSGTAVVYTAIVGDAVVSLDIH